MINKKSILAMTTALFWLSISTVQADIVTLRSLDENTEMTGSLLGFDGDTYQLETVIGVLSLSVSQVTCEGADCPDLMADVNEFVIAGSNTLGLKMMPALIDAYAFELGGDLEVEAISSDQIVYTIFDANGDVYSIITVNLGTSNDAFAALESRDASIGLSSRRVTTAERNRFSRAEQGDLTSPERERLLALDGMVITVNPGNPIRTLSLDQISDIFAGNIRNWREVGGANGQINVYRRDQATGATQVFENLVMAPTSRVLANTAIIHDTNGAVSDAVAQDQNGIGITSVSEERNAKVLSLRSACGQVSLPSEFAIKTEEYPMSRRMFLYTTTNPIPHKAIEFIDFVSSDAAQNIVEQVGFVSQNVATASLNNQGRRLARALISEQDQESLTVLQEMVSGLLEAERLSLTFRFNSGSVSPDNRAVVDLARLAAMVKNGDFDGKNLMIIGFSDNTGEIEENQLLSQARAESIRDALVEATGAEAGAVQFTPIGYGQLSPIGCNETEDGQNTNRRVEIWVR